MARPFTLGAVAYDRKVVDIWEGFKGWFATRGFLFDYVLYSNYERQVEGHFRGETDAAWNSPLAWLQAERIAAERGHRARAVAMRDSDCDLTSVILVRADSPLRTLEDLRGKGVAVGASDSPQATLIPLHMLRAAGVHPETECRIVVHEVHLGKHGDHVGGERDAVRTLMRGEADAACVIDGNLLAFTREGEISAGSTRVLAQTAPYDHCNVTVLDDANAATVTTFARLLLGMSYADETVRPLLDLEGLKEWRTGRTAGYAQLAAACDATGVIDEFVTRVARDA